MHIGLRNNGSTDPKYESQGGGHRPSQPTPSVYSVTSQTSKSTQNITLQRQVFDECHDSPWCVSRG